MKPLTLLALICLSLGALMAEEDPGNALTALTAEVATAQKHADGALKGKNAEEVQKAYQEIDALVAKFEAWEEAAHKAGWGDEKIESEQKKAGWNKLLEQAKKLKDAGATAK
jgi:hypothetical protein